MFDFIPEEILGYIRISFGYIFDLMPLWLPAIFLKLGFDAWIYYRRADYWNNKLGSLVLEIKLPPNVDKSPLAMELVLNQLHQTADESNWYWKYWRGQTRSWFSLEIASFGGDIHFYIWTRKKYKNGIEAHFYSQYPGIEIYEVEDYTKNFYFDPGRHEMFACQWQLSDIDPLPISTYVDYGLDKDPDEEQKIDPMTSQLEFLSSLPPGHNVWIQIILRAHKKEAKRLLPFGKMLENFALFEKYDAWEDEAKEEVKKILDKLKEEGSTFSRLATKGEQNRIEALQRSTSKIGFDTSIRSLYFADKDIYSSVYLGGLLGSFKQYAALGYNGFKSAGWHSTFSDPLKDWWKTDKGVLSKMVLDEYKLRNFFFSPFRGKWFYSEPFILNSEELATVFHLPGTVATAPGLNRVASKKSEAPSNLPV